MKLFKVGTALLGVAVLNAQADTLARWNDVHHGMASFRQLENLVMLHKHIPPLDQFNVERHESDSYGSYSYYNHFFSGGS